MKRLPLYQRCKNVLLGQAKNLHDKELFHTLSLVAFFAWIGLGADGLSSSSYGPEEAFLALGNHAYLAIFVALLSVATILILSASYSQIIELFPSGGGAYVVASKLISPFAGMVAGCALLVDYVLTISISIAAGAAAIFSFLPYEYYPFHTLFSIIGILLLVLANLRGVKESVQMLMPIFMTFIISHVALIFYAVGTKANELGAVITNTSLDISTTYAEIGFIGIMFLILRAYSLGAGTFTGIEAISNGLPILRQPRVKTAKTAMRYMAFSLSFMVIGLTLSYLLFHVAHVDGKTLNAVLFEEITSPWGIAGKIILIVSLLSEAALLLVAAQTGLIGGPRVLANMGLDQWMPTKFTALSDRLVIQNGILIMGISAIGMILLTGSSVKALVVLYSINVFITFVLSQLGMVMYWCSRPGRKTSRWIGRLLINGTGFIMSAFILVTVIVVKFHDGGWITLIVTGSLVALCWLIKEHYKMTNRLTRRLDNQMQDTPHKIPQIEHHHFDRNAKTAVLLVKGYNGVGIHNLRTIVTTFKGVFKNFVFVEVGTVDAGNFLGHAELQQLKEKTSSDVQRFVDLMKEKGYHVEAISAVGTDVVKEITHKVPGIIRKYPNAVFFGGQIVFPRDTIANRLLHNYTVFALQKRLYTEGITFVLLPVQV